MQMQMQMLSVHGTIEILRTHKSVDAFANANAQWERALRAPAHLVFVFALALIS